jgi:alkylhydroperoxidase family enzyme
MRVLRRLRAYARILPRARPDRPTTDAFWLLARRPALLAAIGGYETATLMSNRLDPRLKYLALLKTSSRIGCPFCLDIGSAVSGPLGIDEQTLADLPRYADSDRFSPLEKSALDLAVAMTATPAEVSPALRARLRSQVTPAELAELVTTIAWENHRGRLYQALDIGAMGFVGGGFCLLPEQRGGDAARVEQQPSGLS